MSNYLSNDEAKIDPAITNGFGFVSAFRDVLIHDHLAAAVRSGSIANGIYEFSVMSRARLCEEEEGETGV